MHIYQKQVNDGGETQVSKKGQENQRFLFSNQKRKFIYKVTKAEKMRQLSCVGSGNRLQKQKKGTWSLGERKAKQPFLGEGKGKMCECAAGRDSCRESVLK